MKKALIIAGIITVVYVSVSGGLLLLLIIELLRRSKEFLLRAQ
jgi:hypothetical protein